MRWLRCAEFLREDEYIVVVWRGRFRGVRTDEVEAQRIYDEYDSSLMRGRYCTLAVRTGGYVGERQASEEESASVKVYSSKMYEEYPEEEGESFGGHEKIFCIQSI